MKAPLISIITPVFNGAAYLDECLQSVLEQSYPNLEHVIVDGASTDGTVDILAQYSSKYPGKICFISEKDGGPGEAWNKGFKLAKGDIFNCLGADDICEPGSIQVVADYFKAHPDASFLHGEDFRINEKGKIIGKHRMREFVYQDFVDTTWHISTPSAFYRREVVDAVGGVDSVGDDFDLMLRIAKKYRVHGIDQVLSRLRIHERSLYHCRSDFNKRYQHLTNVYAVSRRHGGARFSLIGKHYYLCRIMSTLCLGSFYPILRDAFNRFARPAKALNREDIPTISAKEERSR